MEAAIDLVHPIPWVVDGFAFAQQLAGHCLQRKGGEIPERRFQRVDAVNNQPAVGLGEEDAVLKTVFAPLQLAVAAAEP